MGLFGNTSDKRAQEAEVEQASELHAERKRSVIGRTSRRMSYANVTATVALFVSLGGASYAAITVPAGSIGTPQLRNGAVTAAKVRAGSLVYNDLNPLTRTLLRGQTGAQGQRGPGGPQGPQGPQGVQGSPGPSTASPELGGTTSAIPANHLYYLAASGLSTPSTTFPNAEYVPNGEFIAKNLFVHVDASPPSGQSWSFALNAGSGDTVIQCTIAAGDNTCWSPIGATASLFGPVFIDAFGTAGVTPTNAEWGVEVAPAH